MKISTLQAFNCKKSVSQKILKVCLLSSFASEKTLATFFRFISSVFSLILKAAYNDSIFLVTFYFSTSFYCDALKKLIIHLQHLLLATQAIILTKQLSLSRNLFLHQCCFSYNLLLQKRFFHYCLQT